jgi:hypothetical protein
MQAGPCATHRNLDAAGDAGDVNVVESDVTPPTAQAGLAHHRLHHLQQQQQQQQQQQGSG